MLYYMEYETTVQHIILVIEIKSSTNFKKIIKYEDNNQLLNISSLTCQLNRNYEIKYFQPS